MEDFYAQQLRLRIEALEKWQKQILDSMELNKLFCDEPKQFSLTGKDYRTMDGTQVFTKEDVAKAGAELLKRIRAKATPIPEGTGLVDIDDVEEIVKEVLNVI